MLPAQPSKLDANREKEACLRPQPRRPLLRQQLRQQRCLLQSLPRRRRRRHYLHGHCMSQNTELQTKGLAHAHSRVGV